jgi:hypothetical protein
MHGMRATEFTVFFEFKPLGMLLFIFCRRVVSLLALGTSHYYYFSHFVAPPPNLYYRQDPYAFGLFDDF